MRHAKIVCTLGPSTDTPDAIDALIAAGMDVARLNFSHGTHESHKKVAETVRALAARRNKPVALMQDLSGPKIRIGELPSEIMLSEGQRVRIGPGSYAEAPRLYIPCEFSDLARDVKPGDTLLLDDGRLRLTAVETADVECVEAEVVEGGPLSSRKGINLPGVSLSAAAMTDKDHRDLEFGLSIDVDFVALSFVRSPAHVARAREAVGRAQLIAKIEKPEAVKAIDGILDHVDGIMVARGDLGVELGPEKVPMAQKQLIERANARGKLTITATEMLDSMRYVSRPTRAEVSDVANALLDGTDAVMLSGETASGKYPAKSVETMCRIIVETESSASYQTHAIKAPASIELSDNHARSYSGIYRVVSHHLQQARRFSSGIALATVAAAQEINARAIMCFTESGRVARMISEYRPSLPIIAVTARLMVYRQLAARWGVHPLLTGEEPATSDACVSAVVSAARQAGLVRQGDAVVVASGSRQGGPSDLLKIELV